MTPATTTGMLHDQNLEKQIQKHMGCMAGFFQLFDRHQLLTGKRIYSTKRLPPPPSVADTASESGLSRRSPSIDLTMLPEPPTPGRFLKSPAAAPEARSQIPVKTPTPSVFEIKEGTRTPWKFRDAPRLSLDSRATTGGSLRQKQIRTNQISDSPDVENNRKSTGVIARLMGLEPPPSSNSIPEEQTSASSPQLRRSASESRVSRDLFPTRIPDSTTIQSQQKPAPTLAGVSTTQLRENASSRPNLDSTKSEMVNRRAPRHQNYYDSADYFPEPTKQSITSVSVYGEIEKRLKMRGIDEPTKDLETLKHILEALQLKGLLHRKKPVDQSSQRNFVYEEQFNEPPIVVMRPSRFVGGESPPPSYRSSRPSTTLNPRRNQPNLGSECLPASSPRCERFDYDRNLRMSNRLRNSASPTRSESSVRSTNSSRKQQVNVEIQRGRNASLEHHRRVVSPGNSPKPGRLASSQQSSPRRRSAIVDTPPTKEKLLSDESSSISDGSISTSSQSDLQFKEGKSLLSRCDKLLQSIAEMNSSPENEAQQPSPVSVLDSSFYKDDELTPSPVLKRTIDFKDLQVEFDDEESWTSSGISTVDVASDDSDFIYVAEVLRAFTCLRDEPDVFRLLEQQQCRRNSDASKTALRNRKLIFDTVSEIITRNKQLPTWKAISSPELCTESPSLPYVWSEFKKVRERDESDQELFQVICGVLKKDLAGDLQKWGECQIEISNSVLDIERLIFKDLIGEAIGDLADSAVLISPQFPRRKLAF